MGIVIAKKNAQLYQHNALIKHLSTLPSGGNL